MKRSFPLLAFFLLVIVMVFCTSAYYLICKGLRQARQDSIGKLNYLITDTTYFNTLFVGGSTAGTGVNIELFDSINKTKSFNAGMHSLRISEISVILKKYIAAHRRPQNIFIFFDYSTLQTSLGVWDFPQYYPFVEDPAFDILIKREHKLLWGKYFPAYALTYMDDDLKNLGIKYFFSRNKEFKIPSHGYDPLPIRNLRKLPKSEIVINFDSLGLEILYETLNYLHQQNVNIYFVLPPRNNSYLGNSSIPFFNKIDAIKGKYNVRILSFLADSSFASKELFNDDGPHLNHIGADIQTRKISEFFSLSNGRSQ